MTGESRVGDRVEICNTLLYDGQMGRLLPNSGHPDDIWDFNVQLDNGRLIGVTREQVIAA